MGRIESEANRMGSLVDDLLLLARLDQGRPLLHEPVDVSRIAAEASSDISVSAPDHPISVDLPDEPVFVVGDEGRLRQVMTNLLANAVQDTPAHTLISVSVVPEAAGVTLVVADSGPGIAPDFQPHAFERFSRADESRNRSSGGSGLGLSIVAAVVEALEGEVQLVSEANGTEVRVRLPRSDSPDT